MELLTDGLNSKLDIINTVQEIEIGLFSTPSLGNEQEFTINFKKTFIKPPIVIISSVTGIIIGDGRVGLVVQKVENNRFTIHSSYEEAQYENIGYLAVVI